MKYSCKILNGLILFFFFTLSQAAGALWTIVPIGSPKITVPQGGTGTIKYKVTNLSKASRTLIMRAIPGIKQNTVSGYCSNPIRLNSRQGCILNLTITGSSLKNNVSVGPQICQLGSSSQCYQPNTANSLKITKKGIIRSLGGTVLALNGQLTLESSSNTLIIKNNGTFTFPNKISQGSSYSVSIKKQPATQTCTIKNNKGMIGAADITKITVVCLTNTHTVSGSVNGLLGRLALENNNDDDLILTVDGQFTFSQPIAEGGTYTVSVAAQPGSPSQTCTVNHGSGTIRKTNVSNLSVHCSTNAYTVGGTVRGLAQGATVELENNNDSVAVSQNGVFSFPDSVASNADYSVIVTSNPNSPSQTCTVDNNGTGTISNHKVTNIFVTCSTNAYYVGGSVAGLAGGNNLTLKNNGHNDLLVGNGPFQFVTAVASRAAYNVSAFVGGPTPQTCQVNFGSGLVGGGDINNVQVICFNNTTTITANDIPSQSHPSPLFELALSVRDLGNPYLTGHVRTITIKNTGGVAVTGLAIDYPTPFLSANFNSNCIGAPLLPGAICTINITPTDSATSDCTQGTAPTPGLIAIHSANTNQINANVVVLGYGCIYQEGYVFSIDDSTLGTESIKGKVVTTSNPTTAPPTTYPAIIWASNGSGSAPSDVDHTAIPGITQSSVANPPISCDGGLDGSCNTDIITSYYNSVPAGYYAAGLCNDTPTDGYGHWYLPAICELGYDFLNRASGCGSQGAATIQNIRSNLVDNNIITFPSTYYWSSTGSSLGGHPAWYQGLALNANDQGFVDKNYELGVACVRKLQH